MVSKSPRPGVVFFTPFQIGLVYGLANEGESPTTKSQAPRMPKISKNHPKSHPRRFSPPSSKGGLTAWRHKCSATCHLRRDFFGVAHVCLDWGKKHPPEKHPEQLCVERFFYLSMPQFIMFQNNMTCIVV